MKFIALFVGLALFGSLSKAEGLLKPGDPFPAWEMVDQSGAKVNSASLKGKTYLLWYYPKAMTSGCTAEGCALRDNFGAFTKAGVDVLGVSFDEPKNNAEFVAKEHFPFRLLSDSTKSLAVQVGAADSTSRIWARRISYLVGPDGTVLKAYGDVNPSKHAGEVLADVQQLKGAAK
jgi:thioredoxin-dependent peroxiredoxin